MTLAAQPTDALASVPAVLRWLGAAVFVLAVPTFILIGNVLGVASDVDFIERGFVRYRVGEVTGLGSAQLHAIAETFTDYLKNPSASLGMKIDVGGVRRPLFNDREIEHMVDVQRLFLMAGRVRLAAGTVLLIVPLVGLALAQGAFLPHLGTLLVLGGGLTVAILLLLGALSLLDFTELWTRFHHVAFTNDLWILDPRTDYLIMLFPEGFWFDSVMRIAMLSAAHAVGLGVVGVSLVYWGRGR